MLIKYIKKNSCSKVCTNINMSDAMDNAYRIFWRVAATNAETLVNDKSRTSKELVAKAIYYNSNRSTTLSILVNCDGITENSLESELIGFVKELLMLHIKRRQLKFWVLIEKN